MTMLNDGVLSAVVAVLPATCYDDVLLRRAAACADFSEWHGMAALALIQRYMNFKRRWRAAASVGSSATIVALLPNGHEFWRRRQRHQRCKRCSTVWRLRENS